MFTRTFDRLARTDPAGGSAATRSRPRPDPGFDALPRLGRLAADLRCVAVGLTVSPTRPRWKEGALFFFDPRRQAELERSPAAATRSAHDPYEELSRRIEAELPALFESVEVRHVARAVPGLWAAAARLAAVCPAARDLADLLAVPDDEVFTVLCPARKRGVRLVARGLADCGQFHVLLAEVVPELLGGGPFPPRVVTASATTNPTTTAGVPLLAEARWQFYSAAALDGRDRLPEGFAGSAYWLWPHTPLATVPRIDGERLILVGPPAYRLTWDVSRRFPALAAELRLDEVLHPAAVQDWLARLGGVPRPKLSAEAVSDYHPARAA